MGNSIQTRNSYLGNQYKWVGKKASQTPAAQGWWALQDWKTHAKIIQRHQPLNYSCFVANLVNFSFSSPCGLLHFWITYKLWSLKANFAIVFFTAFNHNYDHKQRTLNTETNKTDQNSSITNHKQRTSHLVEVNFCFLRGPLGWLMAAREFACFWKANYRSN